MKVTKRKKLIVIKPNGNHSNRLLQNLHFEIFCKEHNIEYHNPTFSTIAHYYKKPCNSKSTFLLKILQIDLLGPIFHHSRIVKKLFSVVWIISKLRFLKLVRFDKLGKEPECEKILLKAFDKKNIIYTAGWRFRLPSLEDKYRSDISQRYSLKESFYNGNYMVDNINKLKSQGYTLIGVHIRRGDYKKWKGGIYYFNDDVYKEYMVSISKQLNQQGKEKHLFVLFSNGELSFKQSDNILISNESWYIDHHLMSNCDYLIGPPSTFTLWASYIGNAKLFHIYDCKERLDINLL